MPDPSTQHIDSKDDNTAIEGKESNPWGNTLWEHGKNLTPDLKLSLDFCTGYFVGAGGNRNSTELPRRSYSLNSCIDQVVLWGWLGTQTLLFTLSRKCPDAVKWDRLKKSVLRSLKRRGSTEEMLGVFQNTLLKWFGKEAYVIRETHLWRGEDRGRIPAV